MMNHPSTSQVLRQKIALGFPLLASAGRAVDESEDLTQVYPRYLCALHAMIRATVPLMREALVQCELRLSSDDLCTAMIPYLTVHIREEQNHDEWLLDDLATIGITREAVLEQQPSGHVAAMVGSQYYWMQHHHPVALLGYIAVMEGYPPNPEMLHKWEKRTGYPATAFRTLLKHSQLDPYHRKDLDETIDKLPLRACDRALIGLSALKTIEYASAAILDATCDYAGNTSAALAS